MVAVGGVRVSSPKSKYVATGPCFVFGPPHDQQPALFYADEIDTTMKHERNTRGLLFARGMWFGRTLLIDARRSTSTAHGHGFPAT